MCDERTHGDLKEEYHKPPPDDYDAIKAFRNGLVELERVLASATNGRVEVKSFTLAHNWELWSEAREADDGD